MFATIAPLSIPSPEVSYFDVFGTFRVHFYALFIIIGIIVAVIVTNIRLNRMGAEKGVVYDFLLLAVPLGIIGARIFHVVSHPQDYFYEGADLLKVFYIWEGGIAIYGALIGGAVGAWLASRWTGIRFWSFADALAPGLIFAQAIGRLGNWFNQELYGFPTDLPWGLVINPGSSGFPVGLVPDWAIGSAGEYTAGYEPVLFHPTFLYEVIWNTIGGLVIIWAAKRFALQWGRTFGLYLVWYSAGRIVWESIRIDPSVEILGLRTNVWMAIFGVIIGLAIMIIQKRRHPGLEPSPYLPGRAPEAVDDAVVLKGTEEFVDVSEPPVDDLTSDESEVTEVKP